VRVLGVDPGLSRCGIGVVDGPFHRPVAVHAGVVRTPPSAPTARRLAALHDELSRLIAAQRPDAVAVERVFFNANVRTAMGVGQAAGVVLLCAEQAGLPVVEYTPTQVKATVAGDGAADKAQVAYMVRAVLRLAVTPAPADAADALALALCHLQRGHGPPGAAHGPAGAGNGAAHDPAGAGNGASGANGMSPRLAAAVEAASPGAQVARR